MPSSNIVHVAVAVIKNQYGQIFIAKRPYDSHQGGLWEFPGGKVESNETVLSALKRELTEEIGITLLNATPLIRIHHDYDDKSVLLDVWCIDEFSGEAFGKEGQKTIWVNKEDFHLYKFPAANDPIFKALDLPDKYMITGEFNDEEDLLARVRNGLDNGIQLIQFRSPGLEDHVYFEYAEKLFLACERKEAKLLLNTSHEKYKKYHAHKISHGLHLNSKEIKLYSSNSESENFYLSTSIHSYEELFYAEKKKVDFVVLSPVKKTMSHPNSLPLGWKNFKTLTDKANTPVFALGGMTKDDLEIAKEFGGQGIAAIGAFWNT